MQKKRIKHITILILSLTIWLFQTKVSAAELPAEDIKLKDMIFEHIQDAYWWHITTINDHHISIYLPVIVYSSNSGFHLFSSARLDHGNRYEGFYIADSEKYAGKIVETDASGQEIRPIDISITKTVFALIFNSLLMIILFLSVAHWYKKRPANAVPGGFVGMVEVLVINIEEDVIRKSIGKDYARYSPFLLTAFFFILINNLMGLIPFFPGGANVTGNIAVTLVLALCTMLLVNLFGNKAYWKDIFWPDVPIVLKVPVPLMPAIEFFSVFSKPFALTVRLFANVTAGHAIPVALTGLIFITVKLGAVFHTGMTIFLVFLSILMCLLEILVAFLQAYVFTMLSAVFIGLSRQEHNPAHHPEIEKT